MEFSFKSVDLPEEDTTRLTVYKMKAGDDNGVE